MVDPAQTPEAVKLHDSAITAVEAWQANPTDDTKKAAVDAVTKAKEGIKGYIPDGYVPKESAPDKYELKLPEGSKLQDAHVEKISNYAREKGFSNERAQALLERDNTIYASFEEQRQAEMQEQLKETGERWIQEVKDDKELGGDNFNKSIELSKQVLARFGDESLRESLNETGLGNNPGLVRMLTNIGKAMSPDQLVLGGTQKTDDKLPIEKVFYGATTN